MMECSTRQMCEPLISLMIDRENLYLRREDALGAECVATLLPNEQYFTEHGPVELKKSSKGFRVLMNNADSRASAFERARNTIPY
jgi:hypothetical protein